MYTPIADLGCARKGGPDIDRNAGQGPFAWLLISPADTPEEWRHRAQQMNLVPLLPEELARLSRAPAAAESDDELLGLVARGSSTEQIARTLNLSRRTVERHLARLRERYHQPTTAALSSFLARRGF